MQRTGLFVGLALIGACGEPRRFEAWPRPTAVATTVSSAETTFHVELPQALEPATYGAQRSSCERFRVEIDPQGRPHYRRIRKAWSEDDRDRFRRLIGLVASELGAEPRLFQAWAMRESTYRPSSLHVLDPDVNGAAAAWRRYAYDADEEARLEDDLAGRDATDAGYWEVKGKLARLRRFKGNAHLYAEVEYEQVAPDGTQSTARGSAWAFGYGPFGFNPAYFVQVWDPRAPPWIFCHDDGIVAIVTAVWAARTHQRECQAAGVGGSYLVLDHRLGRGHCGAPDPQSGFVDRLRRLGLDAHRQARLGKKYPAETTDRAALLETLRTRARAEGLLSVDALDPA